MIFSYYDKIAALKIARKIARKRYSASYREENWEWLAALARSKYRAEHGIDLDAPKLTAGRKKKSEKKFDSAENSEKICE